MEFEADADLICKALFDGDDTWMRSMLSLGTIWLFTNHTDPRAFLEALKEGPLKEGFLQTAYFLVDVTRHVNDEHVFGADARIDLLLKCLRSWDWADEDAHELVLDATSVTLNIDALIGDRNSPNWGGIRADLGKLITPPEEEGTWDAMRPHPPHAINSGVQDFTLMGFEYGGTYVIECPEQGLSWEFVTEETPVFVHLPPELWQCILDWVPPLDRQSFSLSTKSASRLLTSSQRKSSSIWATIFWNNRDVHLASKSGVQLALVGNIQDIGKEEAERPYLFLVTLPACGTKWKHLGIKSNLSWDMIDGASTYNYPEFTININGMFNHGREIALPGASLHQFSGSTTSILYYDSDRIETAPIKRYNAPHDRGYDIMVHLRDGENLHMRCILVR